MKTIGFCKSEYYDLFTGENTDKAYGFIHHSFEADYVFFNERVCDMRFFFPYDKDPDTFLIKNMSFIQEQIKWVSSNRDTIVNFLVDDTDIIESAEYWVRHDKKAEKTEDEDSECYLMRDESKIYLPITKKYISDSLRVIGVSVRFEEDNGKPRLDFCFEFEPNCFMGCFVLMMADENKQLTYIGLARNRNVEI